MCQYLLLLRARDPQNITSSSSSESSACLAVAFDAFGTGGGGANDSPALTNGIGLKVDFVVAVVLDLEEEENEGRLLYSSSIGSTNIAR